LITTLRCLIWYSSMSIMAMSDASILFRTPPLVDEFHSFHQESKIDEFFLIHQNHFSLCRESLEKIDSDVLF
ncbi:hypothetical protein NI467_14285, partial [Acinetobacter bohemicus]|uniref:hypothetical protein n=1 Tax=Acinetobacter sp. S4397-1 TaxID=2972915 RepID=UPI00209BA56F